MRTWLVNCPGNQTGMWICSDMYFTQQDEYEGYRIWLKVMNMWSFCEQFVGYLSHILLRKTKKKGNSEKMTCLWSIHWDDCMRADWEPTLKRDVVMTVSSSASCTERWWCLGFHNRVWRATWLNSDLQRHLATSGSHGDRRSGFGRTGQVCNHKTKRSFHDLNAYCDAKGGKNIG